MTAHTNFKHKRGFIKKYRGRIGILIAISIALAIISLGLAMTIGPDETIAKIAVYCTIPSGIIAAGYALIGEWKIANK
ncbi:MAG TPA: hypothetical protein VK668_20320 [Mucilaginibacter sp.]|nr:hypothetical protein [Mucilaginibacter sp.]